MNAMEKQLETKPHKRTLRGIVVRRSGDKTVTVEVARSFRHSMYAKNVKKTKRYLVHDEANALKEGDQVVIEESRPLSRRKRWMVVKNKNQEL